MMMKKEGDKAPSYLLPQSFLAYLGPSFLSKTTAMLRKRYMRVEVMLLNDKAKILHSRGVD